MGGEYLGVLPTREVRGANTIEEMTTGVAPSFDLLTYERALTKHFDTDAHFVCYRPGDPKNDFRHEGVWVRLNKPVLPALDAAGVKIITTCIALDFDLPAHAPWSTQHEETVEQVMLEAAEQDPLAMQWTDFYTTRAGWRTIYRLTHPILSLEAEPIIAGVMRRLHETKLAPYLDMSCGEWNRIFRLPRVTRDLERTDVAPFFQQIRNTDVLLDPNTIEPVHLKQRKDLVMVAVPYTDRTGKPTDDECLSLLYATHERTGKTVPTEWLTRALKRLRGRECLSLIKEEMTIEAAATTGRNNKIMEMVGQSVGMLYSLAGTTPQLIFAIWASAVTAMQNRTGNDSGKDWLDVLWHAVCHSWDREAAQAATEKKQAEVELDHSGKLSMKVLESVRKWCKHPQLFSGDAEALKWLAWHLIAHDGGSGYHVMTADGVYDTTPVSLVNLPGRIRELGMDPLIEIIEREIVDGREKIRHVHPANLITRHATTFISTEGIACGGGTTIRGIGTSAATLRLSLYDHNKLTPRFDELVDAWLRSLAGPFFERLIEWIAYALDIAGGPICALSICGPPGIGKKLLVQGLAECFTHETVAHGKELVGRFGSQLMRTPIVSVDEGFPKVSRDSGVSDPADAFRSAVSGDPFHIEQKHRGVFTVFNPVRIIISANNRESLRSIFGHKNLSQSDREALGTRILHFDLDDGGARFLREIGGLRVTAKQGARWIKSDDGNASDYVVARHFLWLYHNRKPSAPGQRLLVEGDINHEIVEEMQHQSGDAPEMCEALAMMVNQRQPIEGMVLHGGHIYVTASAVRSFLRSMIAAGTGAGDRTILQLSKISASLRGLSTRGWNAAPRRLPTAQDPIRRYWQIDKEVLIRHCENAGVPCEALYRLVERTQKVDA